ncbi:MAG: hypothetical protein KBC32_02085 [Candidatus Didemnitutus sp.]|nr:hypothetical protein [Candidatus Didemnitutus sp.]
MRAVRFLLVLSIGVSALSVAAKPPYSMWGKQFNTPAAALAAQVEGSKAKLTEVVPGQYYGGSILVCLPPDNVIISPRFINGVETLDEEAKQFFRDYYRIDADFMVEAFERSGLFDSVTLTRAVSYWRYANDYGYRYVFVYGGTEGFTLLDMATNTETKVTPLGTSLAGWVNGVERSLDDLARQAQQKSPGVDTWRNAGVARAAPLPVAEEMHYDETTKRGWVSVKDRGLAARGSILRRIAEICATKNKLLVSGEIDAAQGAFKVLDEELKDGVLKIRFEALY